MLNMVRGTIDQPAHITRGRKKLKCELVEVLKMFYYNPESKKTKDYSTV